MEQYVTKFKDVFGKYKYPILILLIGIALMLIPSPSAHENKVEGDMKIEQILSCTRGVGEAQVLVSENGVVVVCPGADNAAVRLEIIRAISAYTGFGSDKITVLKMAE